MSEPRKVFDKNLGVYVFIDEDGNVTQIKKSKKTIEKYYPNEPTKVDQVDPTEPVVIGILYDVPSAGPQSEGTAMGVGDEGGGTMAYAIY